MALTRVDIVSKLLTATPETAVELIDKVRGTELGRHMNWKHVYSELPYVKGISFTFQKHIYTVWYEQGWFVSNNILEVKNVDSQERWNKRETYKFRTMYCISTQDINSAKKIAVDILDDKEISLED